MRFAMNHIVTPKRSLDDFFALSKALGVTDVEIRNDLPDVVGTLDAVSVKSAADKAGVTILTINALYPFNVWSSELEARAVALADYARDCDAKALVLCPLNDGNEIAFEDTVAALRHIAPILQSRALTGLVEPLGFPVSSMRTKATAIAAIEAADAKGVFKILHDTFHHHLAGESDFYPDMTGLVHISGVTDPSVAVDDMLDAHRVLVDGADRLENIDQIKTLLAAGYDGPFSFEPFSTEVHDISDPEAALRASMNHLVSQT